MSSSKPYWTGVFKDTLQLQEHKVSMHKSILILLIKYKNVNAIYTYVSVKHNNGFLQNYFVLY